MVLLKLVYAVFPIPCFFSSACAGGYIELPLPFHISSVDVAADAISNLSFMPRFSTMSFKINSDIGERQILPWQMKSTLIIKFSCSKMLCNAEFCVVLSAFPGIGFFLFKTTLFAKHFKMVQFRAVCSSQIVVS